MFRQSHDSASLPRIALLYEVIHSLCLFWRLEKERLRKIVDDRMRCPWRMDHLFGDLNRERVEARNPVSESIRPVEEFVRLAHLADQPDGERLVSREDATCEQNLLRDWLSDELHKPPAATGSSDDSEIRFRIANLYSRRRDPEIGCIREFRTSPEGIPINRRDHRHG